MDRVHGKTIRGHNVEGLEDTIWKDREMIRVNVRVGYGL